MKKTFLAVAVALFALGGMSVQAAPVSQQTGIINQAASAAESVENVQYGYGHQRWRSHRRWGSRRPEDDHNRWRSHRRRGSDGGYDSHNRRRSHYRWGSSRRY